MNIATKISVTEGEEILAVVRRYFFLNIWKYLVGLAFLFAGAFFMFWIIGFGLWGEIALGAIWLVGLLIIFFTSFFYHRNFLVITDNRIVLVNRTGLWEENMVSLGWDEIKEVSVMRRGITDGLWGIGSVAILGIYPDSGLYFDRIKSPQTVANLILSTRSKYNGKLKINSRLAVYRSFIDMVGDLSEEELCEIKDLVDSRLEDIGEEE